MIFFGFRRRDPRCHLVEPGSAAKPFALANIVPDPSLAIPTLRPKPIPYSICGWQDPWVDRRNKVELPGRRCAAGEASVYGGRSFDFQKDPTKRPGAESRGQSALTVDHPQLWEIDLSTEQFLGQHPVGNDRKRVFLLFHIDWGVCVVVVNAEG